jgi:hypothetical protein
MDMCTFSSTIDSPSASNAAAGLDGKMSINRTVKRVLGTSDSSPAKHTDVSNEENPKGGSDSDSHTHQIYLTEPGRRIRRRIDEFQELQESLQSELLDLQQDRNHPSENDSRPFSIDFSGTTDQELELENIAAMDSLRDVIEKYHTERPSSDVFQLDFGDWSCFKQCLKRVADNFEDGSAQAKRLLELSLCSDSKAAERFNKKEFSHLIKKAMNIIQNEFFPDSPAFENKEYWISRKKRKTDLVDNYVPNPRMKSLIQSVESNVPLVIELRNREWFTVRDLRALFDSIIKYNSSVLKFDAEVCASTLEDLA